MKNTTKQRQIPNIVYTIGHGTQEYTQFFSVLQKYAINVLIDVRKIPYSAYAKTYNKEVLEDECRHYAIRYMYMGDTLGSVGFDDRYIQGSFIRYDKREKEEDFVQAIERVKKGAIQGYSIVLMCAEYTVHTCHRHILLAKALEMRGITVHHILNNASVIPARSCSFAQEYLL